MTDHDQRDVRQFMDPRVADRTATALTLLVEMTALTPGPHRSRRARRYAKASVPRRRVAWAATLAGAATLTLIAVVILGVGGRQEPTVGDLRPSCTIATFTLCREYSSVNATGTGSEWVTQTRVLLHVVPLRTEHALIAVTGPSNTYSVQVTRVDGNWVGHGYSTTAMFTPCPESACSEDAWLRNLLHDTVTFTTNGSELQLTGNGTSIAFHAIENRK